MVECVWTSWWCHVLRRQWGEGMIGEGEKKKGSGSGGKAMAMTTKEGSCKEWLGSRGRSVESKKEEGRGEKKIEFHVSIF